ncbi:PREDICTED: RNA polymerase I-specific transcription initiation factor RRN3 [Nicrophorus vespilloides]|uniref:RNA polymerase I-specific transcription initiation factor RRN3 n=1 Tax=Nicrophorus vespilloides TaxID=110193 RepID=A0ABM1MY13_NICVS|nr:PREDICTED: RNA polymerase I-specific transcription initiation factor RRN3 [Nicrophorus vespilloides]XP_017779463.1 PREDICTED: RNA polymerase I-specific transcription initiation factor RRN3 [Nicrophorus vespilloides]
MSVFARKRASVGRKYTSTSTSSNVQFSIPNKGNLQGIFENYLDRTDTKDYETLLLMMRDYQLSDENIITLLTEATMCVSVLNEELQLFIEATLKLDWTTRSPGVICMFQSFLHALMTVHNCHIKFIINNLVKHFITEDNVQEWVDNEPTKAESIKYDCIHHVFNIMLKMFPMIKEDIFLELVSQFPYINKTAHNFEVYLYNLLRIVDYSPPFRQDILRLIFSKLVLMDAHAPKEEISRLEEEEDVFEMDEKTEMRLPLAHALDVSMKMIFDNFETICCTPETKQLDWEKAKGLYLEMLNIFDEVILPTFNIHHVQFVMYYICSLKSTFSEAFLNHLWKKINSTAVPTILKQSAVYYMGSLIARASFIPLSMLKGTLQQFAEWIHAYILRQDGLEFVHCDIRHHSLFYCICQTLFYVVAFRQKDLVNTKKNITFLESLNLGKIVLSRLNPLRVCQPAVVQNFAAVTRTYQLAYCYTVMEHNARNTMPTIYLDEHGSVVPMKNVLDCFFPFDPYVLKRSSERVAPHYIKYQEPDCDDMYDDEQKETEEDDFLNDSRMSKKFSEFSYGTSPGFKMAVS